MRWIDLTNSDFREFGCLWRAISIARSCSRLTISSRVRGFSSDGRLPGCGRDIRTVDSAGRPFAAFGTMDFLGVEETTGDEGFALSCSNRSRSDFACAPPTIDLPTEGTSEGFRPSAVVPDRLPDESRSLGFGPAFSAVGVCLTIVGPDDLGGAAGFAGEDLSLDCSIRSRFDLACSLTLGDLPVDGLGEGFGPPVLGPDVLPCENRSVNRGAAFEAVGVSRTIVGVDGLLGATSFGGDGFVGGVFVVDGMVRRVVACSRNREYAWRWLSIIELTREDGVEELGLEAGGVETRFRISASRRKTSLVLCGAGTDRLGGFTLGDGLGGRSVIRGVVGCGLVTIGLDAAGGWLFDRAPIPNMPLMEFGRLSCPRTEYGLGLERLGWAILGGLAFGWEAGDLGAVNDGLGCVNVRTFGLLGGEVDRLLGAGLLRNDLGMLGTLGAAERPCDDPTLGRLGGWNRGAGLGDDLAAGLGPDRAPGPGREPPVRPLNIPRSEFGWAAMRASANNSTTGTDATTATPSDLIFAYVRHMAGPPGQAVEFRAEVDLYVQLAAIPAPGLTRPSYNGEHPAATCCVTTTCGMMRYRPRWRIASRRQAIVLSRRRRENQLDDTHPSSGSVSRCLAKNDKTVDAYSSGANCCRS